MWNTIIIMLGTICHGAIDKTENVYRVFVSHRLRAYVYGGRPHFYRTGAKYCVLRPSIIIWSCYSRIERIKNESNESLFCYFNVTNLTDFRRYEHNIILYGSSLFLFCSFFYYFWPFHWYTTRPYVYISNVKITEMIAVNLKWNKDCW